MFRRLLVALALLFAAAPALAQSFPVTIKHAFGETVIEKAPERIVTWGWGNHDALLALGVVPVAMLSRRDSGGPQVPDRLGCKPFQNARSRDRCDRVRDDVGVEDDHSVEPSL